MKMDNNSHLLVFSLVVEVASTEKLVRVLLCVLQDKSDMLIACR